MSYSSFALFYDSLTQNVDYGKYADYLCELMKKYRHEPGLTLDLACGTGSLTLELARRGIDVYGVDGSPSMLSVAQQKAADEGLNLLFLCQSMQTLDLYGTVDTVVCALDSINHLTLEKDVLKAFQRVSLFLNPGGFFIFDVNTEYKHRHILADNVFIYDKADVYCVWQNRLDKNNCRVSITLDLFGREDGCYHRSSEHFYERAYSVERLKFLLSQAGLKTEGLFDGLTFQPPQDHSERLVVVAQKV
ncbi:MAG TPA: class I SAM-dependent methyltransferase [Caproiciproducens sp.]|nr:class I SAM-dependent methyltransferase [Caproiciproducens sp.]